MKFFRNLLQRQGHFLLAHEVFAWIYIAALALIPLGDWLASSILALITLRKGLRCGLNAFLVAAASILVSMALSALSFATALLGLVTFLLCFLMASLLRLTRSWQMTVTSIVVMILAALVALHGLAPELIQAHYRLIEAIVNQFRADASMGELFRYYDLMNPQVITDYVLGIQAVSILISALASLMLARSIQAQLFNPGGYRQEMLAFRGSAWGIIVLILAALGAYEHHSLSICSLPLLMSYYIGAGVSVSFNFLAREKRKGIWILLPLMLLPFVMLPIYVILGVLDSLFNFRLRLLNSDAR